jgi:hypothetical protein
MADVLLVAWIGENYYPAMAAVLKASERGELDVALLRESEERLEAAAGRLRGRDGMESLLLWEMPPLRLGGEPACTREAGKCGVLC